VKGLRRQAHGAKRYMESTEPLRSGERAHLAVRYPSSSCA